jgi:hypothetical protein
MTTEAQRERKPSYANDDAVRMLTDLLSQVRSGFYPYPRPLSPEAEAAVAKYNDLRRTLDHERPLNALGTSSTSRT